MSCTITNINTCTKKLDFSISEPNFDSWYDKALKEKQQTVTLKGFRPGKAPKDMIEKLYKPTILNDAVMKFVSNELYNEIMNQKLNPVDRPMLTNLDYKPEEKHINFSFEIVEMPQVSLGDLSKFAIKKELMEVSDSEINESLESLVQKYSEEVQALPEDKSQKGDHFHFSMEVGTKDQDNIESLKVSKKIAVLGNTLFPWGTTDLHQYFEGMSENDVKEVLVQSQSEGLPEEFRSTQLKLTITCHKISKIKKPTEEELLKILSFDSNEQLRNHLSEVLKKNKWQKCKVETEKKVLDTVIESNPFDVPAVYVENQYQHNVEQIKKSFSQFGANFKMMDSFMQSRSSELKTQAEQEVKRALLFQQIIKNFDVKVQEDDLVKFKQLDARVRDENDEIINNYIVEQKTMYKLLGWDFVVEEIIF